MTSARSIAGVGLASGIASWMQLRCSWLRVVRMFVCCSHSQKHSQGAARKGREDVEKAVEAVLQVEQEANRPARTCPIVVALASQRHAIPEETGHPFSTANSHFLQALSCSARRQLIIEWSAALLVDSQARLAATRSPNSDSPP